MPPRPKRRALRFSSGSSPSSQHPTGNKPRHFLAGSDNPDRSYHNGSRMSLDRHINPPMASPHVGFQLPCLIGARGVEQNTSQPRGIGSLKLECLAKYPSLVSTARVRRVQAVVLDLADIENRSITVWQARCHDTTWPAHIR